MSSTSNPNTAKAKPVLRRSQGSKAAIIRPVNRRDGKQSFVRIDSAEEPLRPSARAIELEDYVAQIRAAARKEDAAKARQRLKAKAMQAKPKTKTRSSTATVKVERKKTKVVTDTARQQKVSSTELTHADHVNVLQAVAKLDAGQQWFAENNRAAAMETMDISASIAAAEAKAAQAKAAQDKVPVAEAKLQTTTQPISQDLVNDIAAAIASVLTNVPESRLEEKIVSDKSVAAQDAQESLKLSPEVPRAQYTLPVSKPNFVAHKKAKAAAAVSAVAAAAAVAKPKAVAAKPEVAAPKTNIPTATKTVSLSAAAWDVPAFRWPAVTDRILAVQGGIGDLTRNCENMLSPFGKTIAVTAPTRGQGTTTMSITLARLFAASGQRVLLVDGDIMQPGLSKTIGLNGVSWYQNASANEPVGECIIHGKNSGICVMPLSGPVSNVAAHSEPIFDQLDAHLEKVRGEFEVILIDAGPVWQIVDEISHDSHLVDVAMLVNQDTHSNGFAEARERLMDRGIFKFIAAQNSFARRAG